MPCSTAARAGCARLHAAARRNLWLALTRPRFADLTPLAVTAALAILANAAVCGVLSNPHDRYYGVRMVWLATFVVLLVPWRALIYGVRRGRAT